MHGYALCASCAHRAGRPERFDAFGVRAAAFGSYEGALRRAVLAMKRGRRDVATALGTALADAFAADLPRDAVIVPVPTSAARSAARGFDQGVLLAERLGSAAALPVACALRERPDGTQQGRTRSGRLAPRERFACARIVAGARTVLVDDVVTTGATVRDCARALGAAGARVDSALVVARVRAGRSVRGGEVLRS
jgi:predicted amidophosphoribosyltransferase